MKLSGMGRRAVLGLGLILGLILGAAGGIFIGRAQSSARKSASPLAAAVHPAGSVPMPGAGRGTSRGPGAATSAATPNLSALPPAEAWRRLFEIRDPVAKADAVRVLLESMPPAEWPIWLARFVESFNDEGINDNDPGEMAAVFGTLDALMQQMTATHPSECLTAMLSLDKKNSHGDDLIAGLMSAWARRDLQTARQFYEKNIAGRNHNKSDDIARSLVREMAKSDPHGTLEWAAGLTDDRARGRGMRTAFAEILKSDRNDAIALLATQTDLPDRPQLADQIAAQWAKSDPGSALEWAQALPAELRDAASRRAFESWLRQDYNAARAALDGTAPDSRSQLLPLVVQRAPQEQIGALADLLSREPVSSGRAQASETLVRQWVEHDPTAASGWLAQQPVGQVQDRAIVGFVNWADGNEPQAALEWAGTINDPQLRSRELQELIDRYRRDDPAMARSWVNGTSRLSAEERAQFLEHF